MAISSNATGLRPGVVTSTTRPTTPYTGQIIYETDTGYLRVWDGAAWDYLSQSQNGTTNLPISDIGKAWTDWTPTFSSSAGTITSYTVNMAKYAQVQKITIAKFRVTITSAGTAAGNYMYMTLPFTAASDNGNGYTQLGTFREGASTGFTGNIFQTNTNTVVFAYYNNNGVIQTNHTFAGTIVYEAA